MSFDLSSRAPDRQSVASWFEPKAPVRTPNIPDSVGRVEPPEWSRSLPGRFDFSGESFDEFRESQPADRSVEQRTSAGSGAERLPANEPRLDDSIPLKAIQLHDSYLIAETSDGMVVIDQHALHERILYEDLRARVAAGKVESQGLLVPEPVHLAADEAATILEQGTLLAELGLEVEGFGGDTVLVRSVPVMLGRLSPERLVRDLAEHFQTHPTPPTRDGLLAEILHMVACKAAVKAGDKLNPEEIDALLSRRDLVADSHHCPHGRPTALIFTKAELEKQFGRT